MLSAYSNVCRVLTLSLCAPRAQMLMQVYDKLVKCDELLPVAANEVYFKTFRGRWCFLPALPWLRMSCLGSPGSWRIPQREMHDLATCMRRVARVLWALHVTFQEVRVCLGTLGPMLVRLLCLDYWQRTLMHVSQPESPPFGPPAPSQQPECSLVPA